MPLRHALANGDVVEILTQKGHNPSRDWLSFVRTSHARSKIRQWINLNERNQATEVGRKLVEREARQFGVSLKKISEEDLLRVATEYGRAKVEDLYADLGYGKYSARQVLTKLTGRDAEQKPVPEETPRLVSAVKRALGIRDSGVLVLGQDDLMVYRAKCCNPIPGDPIVGLRNCADGALRCTAPRARTCKSCSTKPSGVSPCSGMTPARKSIWLRC